MMSKQYLTLQRDYGKVKCSDLKKVKEEYYGKKCNSKETIVWKC